MKSKAKILVLGPIPPPYMGPSVATEIILNSGLKEEFELIHLDTSDHRDLRRLGAVDFQNVSLALRHYLALFWRVLTKEPDIVYMPLSQTTVGYLRDAGFILVSKVLGRRVVCHLRGGNFRNWFDSARPLTRWFVRTVHSLVDGQIVLCERHRSLFFRIMPPERVFAVSNGRDFEVGFRRVNHRKKVRILHLANRMKTKGVLDTLRAVPSVHSSHSHAEFVFSGHWVEESTRAEFEAFLKESPHLPVVVTGPVSGRGKHRLLASSDIFVFPTYYPPEGHPWVLVEAMAYGLPIVSTDHGCIRECVIDGFNGFLVEKQNPREIAERLNLLVADASLRRRMAENSRRHYESHFTERHLVEGLAACFKAVCRM
ncbi:MAG: glycosyltransferase family 4 protein [Deltaproteobacteria bacterium]|nr:glycosyltransferase family 4 protein [Deltaproteobacteria bacterium]MBW2121674.1 glycosyltransferase family 4 protein [Deltaproteobacteria bacterium]